VLSNQLPSFIPKNVLIPVTAVIFCLSGCSDRQPRPDARAEQLRIAAEKPTMSAQDSFFDGKILVEANLGRGFGGRGRPGGGGHMGGDIPNGRHHGGGMSIGMGGGAGGGSRSGMEPGGDDSGPSNFRSGPSLQDSPMPPVALRLRVTNTTKEAVEVTFMLCKSELGDFAVRPEKLSLAPGQTAEPDPMTSRLGLTSAELALKVGLRAAGKVEQKNLVLKAAATVETPAGPTAR
jgi:hypothetical protein